MSIVYRFHIYFVIELFNLLLYYDYYFVQWIPMNYMLQLFNGHDTIFWNVQRQLLLLHIT